MTPQDHNKVIGIMHLIWGGFNALMMVFIVPFMLAMFGLISRDPGAPPEARIVFGFVGLFMTVFALVFTVPPLLAGYALLKRRSWARAAGIVAACFTALSMPFGTALTVYTLWFLCGQQGEHFYRKSSFEGWRPSLRDGSAFDWEAQRAAEARRRGEYVPPPQPPDWRS
jgi:chromate transport protein ChrA